MAIHLISRIRHPGPDGSNCGLEGVGRVGVQSDCLFTAVLASRVDRDYANLHRYYSPLHQVRTREAPLDV